MNDTDSSEYFYDDPDFNKSVVTYENGTTNGTLVEYGKHDTNDGYFIYYSDSCPFDSEKGFTPKSVGVYISESGGFYNHKEWFNVGKDTSAAFENIFTDSNQDLPDMMIISKRYNDSLNNINYFDKYIDIIHNSTDINNADISVYGFSKGTDYALKFSEKLINTEDVKPLNIALIDPAGHGKDLYCSFGSDKLGGTIDALKRNNANVFMVVPDGIPVTGSSLNNIAASGVSSYIIRTTETDHLTINFKAINDGILGFMAGKVMSLFNNGNYSYSKYINGEWKQVLSDDITNVLNTNDIGDNFKNLSSLNEIDTNSLIVKLGLGHDFTISSDTANTINSMQNIRGVIRTNALATSNVKGNFASTTNVPNECANTLANYYDVTSDLLTKISLITEEIVETAIDFQNKDKSISQNVLSIQDLNSSDKEGEAV